MNQTSTPPATATAAATSAATAIEIVERPEPERATLLPTTSVIERLMTISNAVAKCAMFSIRKPEEAFARLLLGWEHGLGPMTALSEIDIIDGKPALNARTQVAIVRLRKVGNIEVVSADMTGAVVRVTRADWPAERSELVSFTVEDAVRAGKMMFKGNLALATKPGSGWAKTPVAMFIARAQTTGAKRYFQEIFCGLPYTPDELDADVDDARRPITTTFENVPPPWSRPAETNETNEATNGAGLAGPAVQGVTVVQDAANSTTSVVEPAAPISAGIAADEPKPGPGPTVPLTSEPAETGPAAYSQPLSTDEQQAQARSLVASLSMSQSDWKTLMASHSVTSFKDLRKDAAESVLRFLDRLRQIGILRKHANGGGVSDEQWARALAKRGVSRAVELKVEQVEEIYSKLYQEVTPFKRQEIGIDPVSSGPTPNPSGLASQSDPLNRPAPREPAAA